MGAFDQVDIAGAQAAARPRPGSTAPIDVRLLYAANNPRRVQRVRPDEGVGPQAGFNLIDGQSPSWGTLLPTIDGYDASLFGWQNTSTGLAESQANYVTTGSNNYGKYSNPDRRHGLRRASPARPARQRSTSAVVDIEKELVDDAFGTVIFQFPKVIAWNYDEGRRASRTSRCRRACSSTSGTGRLP